MLRSTTPASLRLSLLLLILACLFSAPRAHPQTYDATTLREPAYLQKPWLLHAGDDPAYAPPHFDDSHWTPMDARSQSTKALLPGSHPSVVWYRLHLKVSPSQRGLSIEENSLSHAFDIFSNGHRILKSGSVAPFVPYQYRARLLAPIPDSDIATGSVTIAIRTHISASEWSGSFPGLYYTNLTLGQEHELREHIWLTDLGQNAAYWVTTLFGMGLGLVALALFFAQRSRREYLWVFLFTLVFFLISIWDAFTLARNTPLYWGLASLPLILGRMLFLTLLVFAFLRLRIAPWIWICIAIAAMLTTCSYGGFSTALVAHFAADGIVIIANAGHLSPYLDGVEVPLPGALPLGIASGVLYESTRFQLSPGSRLTFYSDGVPEARNPGGELLGFDRAQALSLQSAEAIVEAARSFGQQDDITVLTIERSAQHPGQPGSRALSLVEA